MAEGVNSAASLIWSVFSVGEIVKIRDGHTPAHLGSGEEDAKAGFYRVVWLCPWDSACRWGGRD
jgi:hypothetical protein